MKLELITRSKEEMTFTGTGEAYQFYFREPTTSEKIEYMAETVKKSNGRIQADIENVFKFKFEFGLKLLVGFPKFQEDGVTPQFETGGKPLSSDKDDPDYNPQWKALIADKFYDKIILKATKYYEGISEEELNRRIKERTEKILKDVQDEGEELDDNLPLANTSEHS